jgi:hypothetical protein
MDSIRIKKPDLTTYPGVCAARRGFEAGLHHTGRADQTQDISRTKTKSRVTTCDYGSHKDNSVNSHPSTFHHRSPNQQTIALYGKEKGCSSSSLAPTATSSLTLSQPKEGWLSCIACMTICCSMHKSVLTYKEIIFSTFSNQ